MIGHVKDHLGVTRVLNYVWGGPTMIPAYAPRVWPPTGTAPAVLTLLSKMPPVTDQGQQGACTGHSSVAPYYVAQVNAGRSPVIMPAPAYMYYNERLLNGQTNQDAGANISDIYRAGNEYGICDESLMPYSESDFTTPPSAAAYAAGKAMRAHIYAPVPQLVENLIGCIHHGGFPINFGVVVYPSFQSVTNGIIPMPGAKEKVEGGHAIDIVGYNNSATEQAGIPPMHFMFRNSWGILWGAKGYGFLPFDYVLSPQLASDFWMIRSV